MSEQLNLPLPMFVAVRRLVRIIETSLTCWYGCDPGRRRSAGSPPAPHALLVLGLRLRKLSCFCFGGAAVIAGDVGDQLQLARAETRQVAVQDQMIAVLMMLIVVDQIADILQPRRRFQKRRSAGSIPNGSASCAKIKPASRATCRPCAGSPEQAAANRSTAACARGVVARGDERLIDHRQQQPVAHTAVMNLQQVDLEPGHNAIDDRQPGDNDVGPIGDQSRHAAPRLGDIFRNRSSRWLTSARVTVYPRVGSSTCPFGP